MVGFPDVCRVFAPETSGMAVIVPERRRTPLSLRRAFEFIARKITFLGNRRINQSTTLLHTGEASFFVAFRTALDSIVEHRHSESQRDLPFMSCSRVRHVQRRSFTIDALHDTVEANLAEKILHN